MCASRIHLLLDKTIQDQPILGLSLIGVVPHFDVCNLKRWVSDCKFHQQIFLSTEGHQGEEANINKLTTSFNLQDLNEIDYTSIY